MVNLSWWNWESLWIQKVDLSYALPLACQKGMGLSNLRYHKWESQWV